MNIIQINKLSEIHDGKKIIFCKTDFLLSEFEHIKNLNNDVVLISGNSDYVINEDLLTKLPSNVKKWYAQNAMIVNDVIECIPLGIENLNISYRGDYHGVGYDHVKIKELMINNKKNITPSKFLYANFNTYTNPTHREQVKNICLSTDFIDWEEPNLTIENFFNNILNYESVVCAQGNGTGDNHRIYETLYMGRIPITFNKIMYDNLHKLYPIVMLEDVELLKDYSYIYNKILQVKNKKWDKKYLSCDYWIDKIKNT
jgi:hypothetical protein